MKKIKTAVIGATGYTGKELVRILLRHPKAELAVVGSNSSPGQKLAEIHPEFRGMTPLVCESVSKAVSFGGLDAAFLALPHGESMKVADKFLKRGCKVIDLSPDFRLRDISSYKMWYGKDHAAHRLVKEAVYGLPELFKNDITKARIIANPGCYATAAILSLAPLLSEGLINPKQIIVDAKSGVSGAGKKLEHKYLYSEANENVAAYAVASHRHMPEIVEALEKICHVHGASSSKVVLTFTPHLVPMTRGIFSCSYGLLTKDANINNIRELFRSFYSDAPFVRIMSDGTFPGTKYVCGTNFCDIGIALHEEARTVIVMAAIDNLFKGASGQAVQNMNLMFGLDETEGLM